MVAGENQNVPRRVAAQDVEVLIDRIRGSLVPVDSDALLRGQQLDEFAEPAGEEAPAALHVTDQALRLVLGADADAPYARVHAVRQREIDDAKLAPKRHGGLRAPVGQWAKAAAAAS